MTAAVDPLGWLGATLDDRVMVEQLIGEGGFGLVYRGRHLRFDAPVAVKCLKIAGQLTEEQRSAFLRDFHQEARLLHRLSRKTVGIVQALDVGAAVSPRGIWTPYIVMEWLEGHALDEEIAMRRRRGQIGCPVAEAVAMLEPAARALAVAHAIGVAHLDVKPGNLFITEDEGQRTIKVLDFGIARVFSESRTLSRALTQKETERFAFTPGYAAPEQYNKRHGTTGPHTDVFALGLVLLELVSGRMALDGDSPLQLYVAAANELVRPSFGANGVAANPYLEQALRRALAVDPDRRFRDAGAMWDALDEAVALEEEPTLKAQLSTSAPVAASVSATDASGAPSGVTATAHRRVCTVLVAEFVGATAAARRLDPEALATFVDQCLEAIARALEEAGGRIEQHSGDVLVASFGLHSESVSAAERAVEAALRLPMALAELSFPQRVLAAARPVVRVGIDTGRIYSRPVSMTTTRGLALVGAPLTVATRLQRSAEPGAVLIGRDTFRQLSGLFAVESVTLPALEGEEPAQAYRVRGRTQPMSALAQLAEREFLGRATRLVGRAAEMEALASVVDGVVRKPCPHFVLLVGPAGIGKSRLLSEMAPRLEADGFAVLAARCSPLAQRTSYALAASLLRTRFHVHEDDPPETAQNKLMRGIRALRETTDTSETRARFDSIGAHFGALDSREIAEQLLRVLGYAAPKPSGDELNTDDRSTPVKHRIAAAFAALAASARRPIAFLCDDLHAADEASLELLDDLMVRASTAPLLVIGAAQPSLLDRRPAWADTSAQRHGISLGVLSQRHLEEMARDRLAPLQVLPPDLIATMAKRAEGYPLTLVETLYLLIDAGAIETSADPWQLHSERVGELALPTTVQGIVQARLDILDPRALQLLCKAAVIGPVFWDGILAELDDGLAADRGPLADALGPLVQRGLVRPRHATTFPDEAEYAFVEIAVYEVAYEMLAQTERRELHRRVAAWLARHRAGDAGAALLARHYERAVLLEDALHAYTRAGAHAAALGQNMEAVHAYRRACQLDAWMSGDSQDIVTAGDAHLYWEAPPDARPADWPERVRLRIELGDVLRRMGELDEAEESYEEARKRIGEHRADAASDDAARWQARIDFRLAYVKDLRGSLRQARQLVERAIAHAELAGLAEERAQMVAHLAGLHLRARDTAASLETSIVGLRICRAIVRRGERWRESASWLLRTLGGVFYQRGRMVRAERCYLQAARLLDDAAHPLQVARVINNVAAARFARGNTEAARDAFRRAFELAGRSGDLWVTMTTLGNLGEVELSLGRAEAARDCLEEAVRIGDAMGAVADVADCHRNLASAWLALDEPAQALVAARRALELARGAPAYLSAVVETVIQVCRATARGSTQESARALAGELLAIVRVELANQPALVARCSELAALVRV